MTIRKFESMVQPGMLVKIDPALGLRGVWEVQNLSPSGSFLIVVRGRDCRSIHTCDVVAVNRSR